MSNIIKGSRLSCASCGRILLVEDWGSTDEILWCCGRPMQKVAAAISSGKKKNKKRK